MPHALQLALRDFLLRSSATDGFGAIASGQFGVVGGQTHFVVGCRAFLNRPLRPGILMIQRDTEASP